MHKNILFSILFFTTIVITSSQSLAQTATATTEELSTGASEGEGLLGDEVFLGLINKKIMTGSGFGLLTLYILYKKPNMVDNFLRNHPEAIESLSKVLLDTSLKFPKEEEKIQNYMYEIGIGEATVAYQEKIEQTPQFKKDYKLVQSQLEQVDSQYKKEQQSCKKTGPNSDLYLQNQRSFIQNYSVLPEIPKPFNENLIPRIGVNILDVSTYFKLYFTSQIGDNLEHDHIPSKAAIQQFFKNKKIISLEQSRNIINNATALEVPKYLHTQGRTHSGKNNPIAQLDAKNLKIATIKDMATYLFILQQNNQFNISIQDLLQSFAVVYARNTLLCLYS